MPALHVVVRPLPQNAPDPAFASLYGLLDVVIDGINITARLGEGQAVSLLAELGQLVSDLARGLRIRGTVQLYAEDSVWELGVERDASDVLLTVFRGGPAPLLATFEKRLGLEHLMRALTEATGELLDRSGPRPKPGAPTQVMGIPAPIRQSLKRLAKELRESPTGSGLPRHTKTTRIMAGQEVFSFAVRAALRQGVKTPDGREPGVERADLHSLFAVGELGLDLGQSQLVTRDLQVFLAAERLLQIGRDVLQTLHGARPLLRRIRLSTIKLEIRRAPGQAELELRAETVSPTGARVASASVSPALLVQTLVEFARSTVAAFVRADRAQQNNLRLRSLETSAQELLADYASASEDDTLTNSAPESYRAFAPPQRRLKKSADWQSTGAMRFVPRWVAAVPGIDLHSTFLCGDRIVVGSSTETACLDRNDGRVLWKRDSQPGPSIVAPTGLLRMHPDGHVVSHDLQTGSERFRVRITPREGGGATGSVVCSPGLPKLFAVAEGDRQITALDLVTGEFRWRHSCRRPGNYKLRRSGKILIVSGGDSALEALDVASGEVVWRARSPLPFTGDVAFDHQTVSALSGASGASWQLRHLDVCSGETLWTAHLDERPVLSRPPLITPHSVVIPTEDEEGVGVCAFDRETGRKLWEHSPGLLGSVTAWLAVDEFVVANSASGVLLAIDAKTGSLRFNHVFSRERDATQPRRLEPVLRSGALFVPQHAVHVVRPSDGEIIGRVPSDLVPDLIRVDERCSVYIAEDSGHLAAFATGPRLALVR